VPTGIAEALGVGVRCVGPTSGGGCLIGSPPSPVGATYPPSIHPPIVRLHTPPSRSQKTIRKFFRMAGEWRAPFQDFQGHSNQLFFVATSITPYTSTDCVLCMIAQQF